MVKTMTGTNFPFPKSINTVYDCLKAVIKYKDSIILDFFACSGMTGHAVMMLNEEDNGNRKFILSTNNEGNIAEEITYTRIKNVIQGVKVLPDVTGIPANIKYFKTAFVSKSKVSDDTKNSLVRKSVELICVREDTFNKVVDEQGYKLYRNKTLVTGILFDLDKIEPLKEELNRLRVPAHIYVFSLTNDTYTSDFEDLEVNHKLCQIP